jgi:hypothetical protein
VELYGEIHHRPAVIHAVWRAIGPPPGGIDTHRDSGSKRSGHIRGLSHLTGLSSPGKRHGKTKFLSISKVYNQVDVV